MEPYGICGHTGSVCILAEGGNMDVAGGRGEECTTGSYAIEYVGTVLASGTVLRGYVLHEIV